METLSYRQVSLQYGFNLHTVQSLVDQGVLKVAPGCTPRRQKILLASVQTLREGAHYVVCAVCGSFQAQITTKHLQSCAGYPLSEYQKRYPFAHTLSELCQGHKAKTQHQRQAQSDKLRQRFQTAAGQATRRQIGEASKSLHARGYREQAAAFLTALNSTPEAKAARSQESRQRWAEGSQRAKLAEWAANNPEKVLASAANARRHNKRKFTKLHQALKDALVRKGIQSITEYEIGYYAVDEAIPEHHIVIEADGCYWHGCQTCGFPPLRENASKDKAKMAFLAKQGWKVLRFQGHLILGDPDHCADQVLDAMRKGHYHHA